MGGKSVHCFQFVESCLDYRSYVCAIDQDLSPVRYEAACRLLMQMGRTHEERMGVVYVRGPWGFFVIPRQGYPKLRASFFHDTPTSEFSDILATICQVLAAFNTSNAVLTEENSNA